MICESDVVSKAIQNLEMLNEKYERLFGRPRPVKEEMLKVAATPIAAK